MGKWKRTDWYRRTSVHMVQPKCRACSMWKCLYRTLFSRQWHHFTARMVSWQQYYQPSAFQVRSRRMRNSKLVMNGLLLLPTACMHIVDGQLNDRYMYMHMYTCIFTYRNRNTTWYALLSCTTTYMWAHYWSSNKYAKQREDWYVLPVYAWGLWNYTHNV